MLSGNVTNIALQLCQYMIKKAGFTPSVQVAGEGKTNYSTGRPPASDTGCPPAAR